MSENGDKAFFPTHADVRLWQGQLEQIVAEEAEMKLRHAEEEARIKTRRLKLQKLIDAASAFADVFKESPPEPALPPKPEPAPVANPPATQTVRGPERTTRRSGTKTWTATINLIVRKAGRGMTMPELREAVAQTHLGDTLARTDKAFYGAISKLENRALLIKHNGRVFAPSAYNRFMADVAAGVVEDIPYTASSWQESPNEIAVKRLLARHPGGLTTPEIVNSLLNNPPPDLAVSKNKNSIYNLLARERERGNLLFRGNRYVLPRLESETSDSEEPDASPNGSGGGSPASSGSNGTGTPFAAHPGATLAHSGV